MENDRRAPIRAELAQRVRRFLANCGAFAEALVDQDGRWKQHELYDEAVTTLEQVVDTLGLQDVQHEPSDQEMKGLGTLCRVAIAGMTPDSGKQALRGHLPVFLMCCAPKSYWEELRPLALKGFNSLVRQVDSFREGRDDPQSLATERRDEPAAGLLSEQSQKVDPQFLVVSILLDVLKNRFEPAP